MSIFGLYELMMHEGPNPDRDVVLGYAIFLGILLGYSLFGTIEFVWLKWVGWKAEKKRRWGVGKVAFCIFNVWVGYEVLLSCFPKVKHGYLLGPSILLGFLVGSFIFDLIQAIRWKEYEDPLEIVRKKEEWERDANDEEDDLILHPGYSHLHINIWHEEEDTHKEDNFVIWKDNED